MTKFDSLNPFFIRSQLLLTEKDDTLKAAMS